MHKLGLIICSLVLALACGGNDDGDGEGSASDTTIAGTDESSGSETGDGSGSGTDGTDSSTSSSSNSSATAEDGPECVCTSPNAPQACEGQPMPGDGCSGMSEQCCDAEFQFWQCECGGSSCAWAQYGC
jgi:hypothetical protein